MQPEEELSRLCFTGSGAWGKAHLHSRSHQSCPRPGPRCSDSKGSLETPLAPNDPQPTTNAPPQLVPNTKATEVCTRDVLPERSQVALGPASTKKSLPCLESSRKRGKTQVGRHRTHSALPPAPSVRRVSRSRSALQGRPPPSQHSPGGALSGGCPSFQNSPSLRAS